MNQLIAQLDNDTFNLKDAVETSDRFAAITGSNFTFPRFLQLTIRFLFVSIAIGFFINLMVGAVQWITAGGDKEGVEKARKRIITSLTGLAVGFSVYLIANIITAVTGVDILNDIFIPRL